MQRCAEDVLDRPQGVSVRNARSRGTNESMNPRCAAADRGCRRWSRCNAGAPHREADVDEHDRLSGV